MTIKSKLMLLLALPLIAFIAISTKAIYTDYSNMKKIEKLNTGVELSIKISKLVHNTQKERGLTAGYIGSAGVKFGDNLQSQRQSTDKKISVLKSFLIQNDFSKLNTDINDLLKIAFNDLSKINNIRSQVDSKSIVGSKAIGYYSNMNKRLLDTVASLSKISNLPVVSDQLVSYSNFLFSKEKAGIERALGTGTLTKDKFISSTKIKYIKFTASQKAYMTNFLRYASPNAKSFYKQTLQGNDIDEVNRIRKVLFSKNENFGIEGSYFFSQITSKINKLKQVDDFLAKELQTTINKNLDETKDSVVFFLILTVVGIVLVIVIAVNILRNIFAKLTDLNCAVENLLTSKDTSSRIEITSQDEIGIISQNFNDYLQTIQNGIDEDMKFVDDVQSVMNRVKNGWFSQTVEANSSNPLLIELKQTINTSLNNLKTNFIIMADVIQEYANHDYTKLLKLDNIEPNGIFEKFILDINRLQQEITNILIENKQNGITLNDGSDILLANVKQLNANTNQAAAALEETAAAVEEEVQSTISNTKDSVTEMSKYGKGVKSSVAYGLKLANETFTSMTEIDEEVKAISEAIVVIDQIAFQTNILSLNAAVEAATAGESGKGFAVVAQEVRNLASRSAEAANEIKALVSNANTKATKGKDISDEMIRGYNQLNDSIKITFGNIATVQDSSKEQFGAISQITNAINQLDQQTQNNASIASQTYDIASQTDTIAKLIVSSANEKEFIGKDSIERL